MEESDIKKFYNKNKSYCSMPFKEIYANNGGVYKLCCHALRDTRLEKYTTQNTNPFDYFFSPEMEEIRNKMMSGEKIDACKVCYDLEERAGVSYRTGKYMKKYGVDFEARNIGLKLRIHGSYCNLGCYMCHPYNSSTRRTELSKAFGKEYLKQWSPEYKPVKHDRWHSILNNILENIHLVGYMNITGGEPLQLPKHWEMVEKIPEEHAKHIQLSYDTNLTEIRYKNHSVFDVADKFKKVKFGVSCDHYQDKLSWIRYPIDVKKFESNLVEAKSLVRQLNCTVSLLNIFDLNEIYDYYMSKFDIPVTFINICRWPQHLSIRNLTDKQKELMYKKYRHFKDFGYIKSELDEKPWSGSIKKMKDYLDGLSKHRKFDWRGLWNEY